MIFLAKTLLFTQNLILRSISFILFCFTKIDNPKRILVFRSSRIGDFICAMPSLNLLRKRYPKSKIILLTLPSASREMRGLKNNPEWLELLNPGTVDEIIFFEGYDFSNKEKIQEMRRKIKSLDPDVTFILPFVGEKFWSSVKKFIFLRFLGVTRNLYGWKKYTINTPFFRKTFYRMGAFQHQVFGGLNSLEEYGIDFDSNKDINFNVHIKKESINKIDDLWREHNLDGKPIMAVFPGVTFEHRKWPLENFKIVCQKIVEKYGIDIVVTGKEKEKSAGLELVSAGKGKIYNLVDLINLNETAELFRRSILYLGNDSGPAHLASAVGTPCVTIFSGITFPGIWEPWNSRDTAVRVSVPCEFCFSQSFCPNKTMICTRNIRVERVLELCYRLIDMAIAKNTK